MLLLECPEINDPANGNLLRDLLLQVHAATPDEKHLSIAELRSKIVSSFCSAEWASDATTARALLEFVRAIVNSGSTARNEHNYLITSEGVDNDDSPEASSGSATNNAAAAAPGANPTTTTASSSGGSSLQQLELMIANLAYRFVRLSFGDTSSSSSQPLQPKFLKHLLLLHITYRKNPLKTIKQLAKNFAPFLKHLRQQQQLEKARHGQLLDAEQDDATEPLGKREQPLTGPTQHLKTLNAKTYPVFYRVVGEQLNATFARFLKQRTLMAMLMQAHN